MVKKNTSMWLDPTVAKRARVLGAQHDVAVGDVFAAGLLALEALPPDQRANLLASFDTRSGRILAPFETEMEAVRDDNAAQHVRNYKLEAGVDPDADPDTK